MNTPCTLRTEGKQTPIQVVSVDGREIGFIRKYAPRKGYRFPWQAFGLVPQGELRPNELFGTFYTEDGGKKAAIQAVIDADNNNRTGNETPGPAVMIL